MADGNNRSFLLGTVIGSLVGASLALVFAPKSGKELRVDLNRGTRQAINRAGELKGNVQEKSSIYSEKVKEKGTEWKDKGVEFTKQAADSTSKFTKEVSEKTSEFAQDVSSKTKDVAKDVGGKTKSFAKDVGSKTKDFAKDVSEKSKATAKDVSEKARELKDNTKRVEQTATSDANEEAEDKEDQQKE